MISTLNVSAKILSITHDSNLPRCLNYDGRALTYHAGASRILYSFSCLATARNKCGVIAITDEKILIKNV